MYSWTFSPGDSSWTFLICVFFFGFLDITNMSSVDRAPAQIPANKLYVNIAAIQSSIVDTNLSTVSWVTSLPIVGQLSTAGAAVLRDMGKTVYLPSPYAGSAAIGSQSTVLRKVQLVSAAPAGYYGTGGADANEYFTGYISLGGQTFGGGNGTPARVARLN
jgi:hypothetical protein